MSDLKQKTESDLQRARQHLVYSFNKVSNITLSPMLSEEQLETLESFSSRFARFSDILISRYFRTLLLEKDPAFRGSVIDLINQAEKFSWIRSAVTWRRIRELRNVAAHEYTAEDYMKLYEELIRLTPELLSVIIAYP